MTFLAVRAKNLNRNNSFCSISQTSKPAPKSPLLSLLPWPAIAFLILVILVIFPSVFPVRLSCPSFLSLSLSLSLSYLYLYLSTLYYLLYLQCQLLPNPPRLNLIKENAQGFSLRIFEEQPPFPLKGKKRKGGNALYLNDPSE